MSYEVEMRTVAHHLQMQAKKSAAPANNAFARSSFNRYYYGVFLTVRSMLATLDSAWSKLPHASYPEVLGGQVTRQFKAHRRNASRSGDGELVKQIDVANRAIAEICKILVLANSIRKIADYEPEELVDFEQGGRFSLRKVDVTEAYNWEPDVETLCKAILAAWRQANV